MYKHIINEERHLINYLFYFEKKSISQIAQNLKRNKSTISRELKINSDEFGFYDAHKAHQKSKIRSYHKYASSFYKYQEFTKIFVSKYDKNFHGIEATYQFIKKNYPNIKIPSFRQIFNWFKSNRWELKKSDKPRKYYKKGRKRKKGIFSKFENKFVFPIWTRPKYIDLRKEYGHWEADLIIGKRENGFENLVSLTERKTRENYYQKIKSKNPMKVN
ncbi:IS30 family transposase [Mesomycoplasma lagogenitalium]|uniref:IS30 family transposase n=1 Tax=Mesomycoplasma lagogenitalium TaxID=171286 RepID=A0ABY8LV98_9BACT|nr:IS30 family transposase [Mesomycoplasma lagogenitalium]WGI36690.1 IS30 family transposase [Mesomycoplasma lagogenitalium]